MYVFSKKYIRVAGYLDTFLVDSLESHHADRRFTLKFFLDTVHSFDQELLRAIKDLVQDICLKIYLTLKHNISFFVYMLRIWVNFIFRVMFPILKNHTHRTWLTITQRQVFFIWKQKWQSEISCHSGLLGVLNLDCQYHKLLTCQHKTCYCKE